VTNKVVTACVNINAAGSGIEGEIEYQTYEDFTGFFPGITQYTSYNMQLTETVIDSNWFYSSINSTQFISYELDYKTRKTFTKNAYLSIKASVDSYLAFLVLKYD
jgi:hypothetical protein